MGLVPQENLVSDFILEALRPYTTASKNPNKGSLTVERYEFVAGRGNVIITYTPPNLQNVALEPGQTVAFIGSHLDVVPANPEGWDRNPFELSVEGDKLFGRGTTDCLGHVALLTGTVTIVLVPCRCSSMLYCHRVFHRACIQGYSITDSGRSCLYRFRRE